MPNLEERLKEYDDFFVKCIEDKNNIKLREKLEKMYIELKKDLAKIGELYIGDKSNAENVLLRRMREETPFWENL